MNILNYITQNALELVPALYVIGLIIKGMDNVKDKYIPIILLAFGILGSVLLLGLSVNSVIQGILVTGAAVYSNQLVKQLSKKE